MNLTQRQSAARLIVRHNKAILTLWSTLALASTAFVASNLKIDTDFRAMLDKNAPSVVALRRANARFGAVSPQWIVLQGAAPQILKRVAKRLEIVLPALDQVSSAHAQADLSFFRQNALLYLSDEELSSLDEVVTRARLRVNPLFVELEEPPRLELNKFESVLPGLSPQGWLRSKNALLLMVRLRAEPLDLREGRALEEALRASFVAAVHSVPGAGSVRMELIGSLATKKDELAVIERDLNIATLVSAGLIGLALLFAFRRATALVILLVPLFGGVMISLAYACLVFEALNLLTAFVIALMLGLGVDAAIHLLSSFRAAYAGCVERALSVALAEAGRATVVAALTTAGVLLVMTTSSFAAYAELGWVAGGSMLITAASVLIAAPALIVLLGQGEGRVGTLTFVNRFAWSRSPGAAWTIALASFVFTVYGLFALSDIGFDESFRRFHIETPTTRAAVKAVTGKEALPTMTIVLTQTPELARTLSRTLREDAGRRWPAIETAVSLHDFVPRGQAKRPQIDRLQRRLGRPELQSVHLNGLPVWLRTVFSEAGPMAHEQANTVLVFLAGDDLDGRTLTAFASQLNEAVEVASTAVQRPQEDVIVASASYILIDLLKGLKSETLHLLPMGLMTVLLIIALALREPKRVLIAFAPVLIGLCWLAAALRLLGLSLDMFNIAALLMVIGLGVDDGVHLSVRLSKTDGAKADVYRVWQEASGSVLLTSVTTALGFGSLFLTHHPGLRSLALASVLGILFTTIAALLVVPSVLLLKRPRAKVVGGDAVDAHIRCRGERAVTQNQFN